ncbi:uncharacterized protein LOC110266352 [Arachis ipaensis]|uniref:uncharacterized protein LOC110266352 n=1 Tax=Arachis ipaensis TaxID=130454 RepID=UPI000A2B8855|nr:uncharacterized protein LOC110266352 [Arachis ipaensis]
MGKKGGGKSFPKNKKAIKNDKKSSRHPFSADDMDDEIDAFNKQRDIIPLDVNADAEESDEDDEVHVFDKGIDDKEHEDFDDDEEEDNDDSSKICYAYKWIILIFIKFIGLISMFQCLEKLRKIRYVSLTNETPYGMMKFIQVVKN